MADNQDTEAQLEKLKGDLEKVVTLLGGIDTLKTEAGARVPGADQKIGADELVAGILKERQSRGTKEGEPDLPSAIATIDAWESNRNSDRAAYEKANAFVANLGKKAATRLMEVITRVKGTFQAFTIQEDALAEERASAAKDTAAAAAERKNAAGQLAQEISKKEPKAARGNQSYQGEKAELIATVRGNDSPVSTPPDPHAQLKQEIRSLGETLGSYDHNVEIPTVGDFAKALGIAMKSPQQETPAR